MLSEGFQMHQALERAGISPEKKHPKIEKVPRTTGPCLHVCLNADGHITSVLPVPDEALPRYWQFSLTNGSTFPVTRIRDPLMERAASPPDSDMPTEGKSPSLSVREKLLAAIAIAKARPIGEKEANYYKGLYRENGEIQTLLRRLDGKSGGEKVVEVIRRFQKAFPYDNGTIDRATVEMTLNQLSEIAKAYLRANPDDRMAEALNLLCFDAASGGGKTLQLAFDLDTSDESIYVKTVRSRVVSIMLETEGTTPEDNNNQRHGICALSGRNTPLQSQAFPTVRLPIIFEKGLPLFSMNTKEAECNSRYHQKDSELYPISPQTALEIQDAYGYLLHEDRKGRTWQIVASDDPDSRDLLIAYLDSNPNFTEELATFFDRVYDEDEEEAFEIQTRKVCDSLRTELRLKPKVRVAITVIRKASEGQGFVLFSEFPTAEEVIQGAEWWQKGLKNLPLIRFPVFRSGEAGILYLAEPLPIKPGNIVSLLTEAWTEARGTAPDKGRANKLRGESFATSLSLMVEHPHPRAVAADRLLAAVMKHTGSLLVRIGACQWRHDFSPFKNPERKKALRAISLIGLTLYALNQEDYMQKTAFLIGRFLALVDRLHYDYCMVVRDGQIPPNLIGNAALATALKDPEKALVMLSERMRIYIAWATKVNPATESKEILREFKDSKYDKRSKADYAGYAKGILHEYRAVADALAVQEIPDRCNDQEKAQMLLGYLASTKSADESGDGSKSGEEGANAAPQSATEDK